MKKIGYLLLNIFLATAIILFVTVFLMTIFTSQKDHAVVFDILPICLVVFGIIVVYLIRETHSAYQLFIGLLLILTGIFTFLKMRNYISGSIINWWPIFGILSGVTLFVSGIYKYRKMSFGFVIPAIVIIILSAWFMLFSFKIITVPFKTVAIIGGPLLLVMLCVLLFVIFFIQQKGIFFVSSDEEPKQFEDDEIIPQ